MINPMIIWWKKLHRECGIIKKMEENANEKETRLFLPISLKAFFRQHAQLVGILKKIPTRDLKNIRRIRRRERGSNVLRRGRFHSRDFSLFEKGSGSQVKDLVSSHPIA